MPSMLYEHSDSDTAKKNIKYLLDKSNDLERIVDKIIEYAQDLESDSNGEYYRKSTNEYVYVPEDLFNIANGKE
jgi:hypothetical protein